MAQSKPDAFSDLDPVLAAAPTDLPLWIRPRDAVDDEARVFVPDYATLKALLAVPIRQGWADKQQSGRVARSIDAYVAYELRRAGFDTGSVFPRDRQPRVLSPDLAKVELATEQLLEALEQHEQTDGRLKRDLRLAIRRTAAAVSGSVNTDVLGRFYTKQVDAVVLSNWLRGPDVLVSGKTQFSSYLNNKNNRYEEAIGEAVNLRDRYPLTAIGFAYLVRSNIFTSGAFELLRDQLVRLRKPDGPFDATVLLVADWEDESLEIKDVEDPAPTLSLPGFFEDLLNAGRDHGFLPTSDHRNSPG